MTKYCNYRKPRAMENDFLFGQPGEINERWTEKAIKRERERAKALEHPISGELNRTEEEKEAIIQRLLQNPRI